MRETRPSGLMRGARPLPRAYSTGHKSNAVSLELNVGSPLRLSSIGLATEDRQAVSQRKIVPAASLRQGSGSARPASAKAPARRGQRRLCTPNAVGGHERDCGSSEWIRLRPATEQAFQAIPSARRGILRRWHRPRRDGRRKGRATSAAQWRSDCLSQPVS